MPRTILDFNTVRQIYESILSGKLSFAEADRWAMSIFALNDHHSLEYQPSEAEPLLRDAILALAGIDRIDASTGESMFSVAEIQGIWRAWEERFRAFRSR